jgi:Xaa-Pro aminopeptidase
MQIEAIQRALRESRVEGWLLYDFRNLNPIAQRVAEFNEDTYHSRRWFCFIPAQGDPSWLHHAIEAHHFEGKPGEKTAYIGWRDMEEELACILKGRGTIAMEYSPGNAIPYVSRVDAGTIEMVRGLGVRVTTSADLVSAIEATWDAAGLASHRKAAAILTDSVRETHAYVTNCLRQELFTSEFEIQQRLAERLRSRAMVFDHDPIVAVGEHSANPHFAPTRENSTRIRVDDVLLIDLWGKLDEPGAICADITWMAYMGSTVPDAVQRVWGAVAGARDAAVKYLERRCGARHLVRGFEVDDIARDFLKQRGMEAHILHRLGHSIGTSVHANGANLDHLETRDERHLLPNTGFSIEPGIYLPEQFGVRSEIDVYLSESGPEVTTPRQEAIPALLS